MMHLNESLVHQNIPEILEFGLCHHAHRGSLERGETNFEISERAILLNATPILSVSRKQKATAQSTCESVFHDVFGLRAEGFDLCFGKILL